MSPKPMKRAVFFLTIIFFSNLAGMYYNMYLTWWFDMIHHFMGGFFVAMLMVYYLSDMVTRDKPPEASLAKGGRQVPKIKSYLVIVGAVTFIGVVWEFAEYLASQTLIEPLYKYFQIKAYFIGELDDTINDLLMDILGALSWLLGSRFQTIIKLRTSKMR